MNLKQKTAKKIVVGNKKAIYYRTLLKNGRTRKNYIQQKCRRIGTQRFWNKIHQLRHRGRSLGRGLKKNRKKRRTKKHRKRYR